MSRAALFVIGQFALFAAFGVALIALPMTGGMVLIGLLCIVAAFAIVGFGAWEHMARNSTLPYITPTPNKSARLVDTGVYSLIRHPLYTGVMLAAFGAALAHGHLVPLLMIVVFVVFFSLKARYEESMLRQVYPQYADYMTHTGRFIPGVNFI